LKDNKVTLYWQYSVFLLTSRLLSWSSDSLKTVFLLYWSHLGLGTWYPSLGFETWCLGLGLALTLLVPSLQYSSQCTQHLLVKLSLAMSVWLSMHYADNISLKPTWYHVHTVNIHSNVQTIIYILSYQLFNLLTSSPQRKPTYTFSCPWHLVNDCSL